MGTKRTKQQDFQTTLTKANLVLNPSHGIKKLKAKTRCAHNVNAKRLYYKNMTIYLFLNHDKDMNPKLVLNILKVMWHSTSIDIHWAPSSKELFEKLPTYMWSMFTHV
jgi:hypothetical protein